MTPNRPWSGATVEVAAVPAGGMAVNLRAGAADRRAMAERLQLPGVEAFSVAFALRPEPGRGLWIGGRLTARLTRRCVVTDETFEETLDRPVETLVVGDEGAIPEDDGADGPDYEVAPDGRVDLAELAVQLAAVSMAAWPRGPGADAALAAFRARNGAADGSEAGAAPPENPLAALRERMAASAPPRPRPPGRRRPDGE